MNKVYLTLYTLSLSFVVSTSVFAATSDSMTIEPSYKSNNKHAHNTHDNDFYDPNHVTNDRNNILTNTKKNIFNNTNNNQINSNRVNNTQMNNRFSNDGNYYHQNVSPTPVANTANTSNDDGHMDYGWLGLLGLAGFLGLRKRERVD